MPVRAMGSGCQRRERGLSAAGVAAREQVVGRRRVIAWKREIVWRRVIAGERVAGVRAMC